MELEITDFKISPYPDGRKNPLTNTRAICQVTVNESLIVSDIKIKEGTKGIYITFPKSIKFVNKDIQKEITNRILASYVVNHCCEDYKL